MGPPRLPDTRGCPPLEQVGAFQVLLLGRDPDAAFAPLARLKPFLPFRDASCGAPCFLLRVQVRGASGASHEDRVCGSATRRL
jgi:hypothetical protein